MVDISIEMKIWLNKEVVELVLRNESRAKCCEQCPREIRAGSWSRVFGGIRLFSGSGRESSVSQLNPLAAVAETSQIDPTRNYALEVELTKAKALVHLNNLSRHMM